MRLPTAAAVTPSTSCCRVRSSSMAYKIDLGFHHHGLVATAPQNNRKAVAGSDSMARGSSGPLLSPPEHSNNLLTCLVRGAFGPNSRMVVRCLPAADDGMLDLSGTEPTDAIIGDVDTEPRPGLMNRETEQQRSNPPRSNPTGDASLAHALKAHIPKGPLAEDAAMCEPYPGDEPGVITEEELQAMRSGRPASTPSRFAAAQARDTGSGGASRGNVNDAIAWGEGSNTAVGADQLVDTSAGRAEEEKNAGQAAAAGTKHADDVSWGEGGSNTPADDPEFIKQVVKEETLRDDKYNEARAKFNDL